MSPSSQPIVVLGAGVLGLSTARLLQSRYPSKNITIVAAELPSLPATWTLDRSSASAASSSTDSTAHQRTNPKPSADYASMWAGAHYRPIPQSTPQLRSEAELAMRTAETMRKIAVENPEAGVELMDALEYSENPPKETLSLKTGDIYAGEGDNFQVLTAQDLQARTGDTNLSWGCEYKAYCVNVHVYSCWLLSRFLDKGGRVVSRKYNKSAEEVFDDLEVNSGQSPIVVNCSGRNFDSDPKMKIIRGQTVLVRNPYHRTITRQNSDGTWAFLIPRPCGGGTVVGGTKEIGDEEVGARAETRRILLENAVAAFPDFVNDISKFDVVMDNVGRRPWRDGGLRIEIENLDPGRTVVHGYGAGGRGYELSWGVAEQIVDLVDTALSRTAKL